MKIEQFEDKSLSHYSYAILSECAAEIVLIDPSRNIAPYLDFAQKNEAKIIGVIETHPHADFVSGHLELHQTTGAILYCSKLLSAAYPHQTFDDGDEIFFGKIKLKALNTPGHSPDSICIVLEHNGKDHAVFTGDTLFIGDCGRPDLRETAGAVTATRQDLARKMYYSLRLKLMVLADTVLVYPAHGAGTLCGKALSEANLSSIGAEKMNNWSLADLSEETFIKTLLEDQPFVPKYFRFDVELNKKGAPVLANSIQKIEWKSGDDLSFLNPKTLIIDTRPAEMFKNAHLPNSINLLTSGKLETWLGAIVAPGTPFYLVAANDEQLKEVISRIAKIGYEAFVIAAFVFKQGNLKADSMDLSDFEKHPERYQIVDIRNQNEREEKVIFTDSLHIPLPELMERVGEIPVEKPIVVHCAGGYRSAAGASIIQNLVPKNSMVYDLSTAVLNYL
ncbi:MAG: MBL fold metallo-hydrolase [Janthinobacterium lividum]